MGRKIRYINNPQENVHISVPVIKAKHNKGSNLVQTQNYLPTLILFNSFLMVLVLLGCFCELFYLMWFYLMQHMYISIMWLKTWIRECVFAICTFLVCVCVCKIANKILKQGILFWAYISTFFRVIILL